MRGGVPVAASILDVFVGLLVGCVTVMRVYERTIACGRINAGCESREYW